LVIVRPIVAALTPGTKPTSRSRHRRRRPVDLDGRL